MTPDEIEQLFTLPNGDFVFARWGRPIVPVVFGVEDETLQVIKGAIEAVVTVAGHKMAETDPELGANLMMFFFRNWDEILQVPNLDRMVPDLAGVVEKLKAANSNQYRAFRFDNDGGIQACFVFLRMQGALADMPADSLALGQAVQSILLWSQNAFSQKSMLAVLPENGTTILRPEIGAIIRAAYDVTLPASSNEKSHALRLFARVSQQKA